MDIRNVPAETASVAPGFEQGYAVRTRGLTKAFDGHVVVDHVDLEVRDGEIFGLIGPNGAGKSTLIKMLTTLLPPTSGEATVAGCDLLREARLVRARIGYVPQLLSADGALTGRENLLLSARLYLLPRKERAERIAEALAMTGLEGAADRPAQNYSGGMLRRLEIAQSTLHRPRLLIMDEPTVGLDPVARNAIWDHVRDLRTRFGTTILITTHVMEEVEALCDRVGILHHGRLEKVGTPAALKAEIGPDATLDDVFAQIAGTDIEMGDEHGNARESRRSAIGHG
ncbi:ATP-binding cassette domain-containing protein [Kaistia dalseonensis]|uniref:ABC-2 type transport system ATP-binding protein n=1 Tax=Kaistia dalseonensis TaxID=410840 RepID=A0ABU0H6J2_9HYPH|nr:ATP-binding cassette domain-containing protein [Kaistia dalseonensis]MCX5495346.1 ATP-binding cassette domain-containing protein [Kaistia dalseonensis]MDQ0437932.1 ABC-2 type transport system ATP-binding protein [Kaistia dalseonensis]